MNIYVGSDYEGTLLSILLADSREKADLVWMGMQVAPHSVEEIDPSKNLGMNGVAILVTSYEVTANAARTTYRKYKRGS